MQDQTYKLIEIVGTSSTSVEDAVQKALSRSGATVRNMRWFQIVETRGAIENGRVAQWQVTLKVGFSVDT